MHFKKLILAAALLSIASCETTENTSAPTPAQVKKTKKAEIRIRCFEEESSCNNQIGIINKSKKETATHLNVTCADKNDPMMDYKLVSDISLEPGASHCIKNEDVRAHCKFSYGFFWGDNVAVTVTSDDLDWEKSKKCSWN